MKIGIGVTAYKRHTDEWCIDKIKSYAPKGSKFIVVKDIKGIALAKNMCLEELDKCDHIFLFDSDTYPKNEFWYLPYISSGINHLSFTFSHLVNGATNGNRKLEKEYNELNVYQNPSGCMLYLTKQCIDTVGGFDEAYGGYSYEHVDYSRRIYNAGLTPYPFMDVKNSLELLHSMDYHREVKSSLHPIERLKYISKNRELYYNNINSKEYKEYK